MIDIEESVENETKKECMLFNEMIDNRGLLENNKLGWDNNILKIKKNLKPGIDFIAIPLILWQTLVLWYEGGPVIQKPVLFYEIIDIIETKNNIKNKQNSDINHKNNQKNNHSSIIDSVINNNENMTEKISLRLCLNPVLLFVHTKPLPGLCHICVCDVCV